LRERFEGGIGKIMRRGSEDSVGRRRSQQTEGENGKRHKKCKSLKKGEGGGGKKRKVKG